MDSFSSVFTSPELESVLLAGYSLGLSPVKLLTEELSESEALTIADSKDVIALRIKKGARRHDKLVIKHVLESAAYPNDSHPVSLSSVCSTLKCDFGYVTRQYPKLAAAIKKRYKEYVGKRSYQRVTVIARKVRKAILDLHSQQIFPNLHKVKIQLAEPNWIRERWVRDMYEDTLIELGYKDGLTASEHNQVAKVD